MRLYKLLGTGLIVVAVILITIFSLIKINFDAQGVFLCEAVSSNPSLDMTQCPAHTSSIPTFIMIGFFVSALLVAMGVYLLVNKNSTPHTKHTFSSVDSSSLNDIEAQIYNFIKENKGSVYQSEIVTETGLNKVKVTRILDKLEHNDGIIERKRRGMANIVVLK
jgi:uncharacterized membrane protein